jgi:hypothetical protein
MKCEWCGKENHDKPIRCQQGKECPHCGGIHFGSTHCPYSKDEPDVPFPSFAFLAFDPMV